MKKIVSFFMLSLVTITINGQHINIKSPQAYEMERYGNIPVDLSVGAIDLSIPIFKTNIGNQNFDISLKYNSSGFIPSKKSNYVGHDWFLNFGGMISRETNGIADDDDSSESTYIAKGYLIGARLSPKSNDDIYNGNYNKWYNKDLESISPYQYELQPDKFSFNFMGISGYFFIGSDGVPIVASNDPNLRIDISKLNKQENYECTPNFSEIIITDGKGIKYFFGGDHSNLEISYQMGNSLILRSQIIEKPVYSINNWYLKKIIYPNNNYLDINYIKNDEKLGTFCTQIPPSPFPNFRTEYFDYNKYVNQVNVLFKNNYDTSMGGYHIWGKGSGFSYIAPYFQYTLTKKVFPSKIFLNGNLVVDFTYNVFSSHEKKYKSLKLNEINIINENQIVDKIKFEYYRNLDWFFLTKISFSKNRTYHFDYYRKESLPKETTFGIDFWGYWNGINENDNYLIPQYRFNVDTGDYTIIGTERNPNTNLINTGLLKNVIYPTGGSSSFYYEPHTYSKKLERDSSSDFFPYLKSESGITGGARISKIVDINDNSTDVREFKYVRGYGQGAIESSGISNQILRFMDYIDYKNQLGGRTIVLKETANNIAVNSLVSSPVSYSEVAEIRNNVLQKKHYFSDYITNPDTIIERNELDLTDDVKPYKLIKNFHVRFNSNAYQRGRLLKTQIYNNNILIQEIENEYTPLKNHSLLQNTFIARVQQILSWVYFQKEYIYPYVLKNSTFKEYRNKNTLITKTNYLYNSKKHLNPTDEIHTFINGKIHHLKNQYAHEKGNNYLINKNIVGIPLETTVTQDGKIISKTETIYPTSQAEANTKTQGLPMPVSSIGYDLENPSKTNQNITYTQYDNKGNLIEYKLNGITPVVIIWGYHQTLPIAKIEGATYDQVKNLVSDIISKSNEDKDEVSEKNLIMALDNFRNKEELKNFQITTYTHNPLIGVTSITPPSGIREIYKYDDANRLKLVLDIHGNILKEYNYHYAGAENEGTGMPSEYKNTALSRKFTKNNCTEKDYVGTEYTYNVPSGKYVSTISQADANQKAFDEIDANGQNEANRQGTCYKVYYNNEKRKVFSKKDCPSGNNSTAYTYIVPAKKYLSKISQDDADQKAEEEIKNRGQKQADQSLRCIPSQCAVTPIENPVFVLDKNTKISIKDGKVLISPPAKIKNGIYYGIGINTTLIGIIEDKCIPDTMLSHSYKPFEQERHIAINPNGEIFLSENPLFWSGPVLEPDEPIIELIPANKN